MASENILITNGEWDLTLEICRASKADQEEQRERQKLRKRKRL